MAEPEFIPCMSARLPDEEVIPAATFAIQINPANRPPQAEMLAMPNEEVEEEQGPQTWKLALLTTKYWGAAGVRLTVGFMDNAPADLRARILQHFNAWGERANVVFVMTQTDPQVRVARTPGQGYYSYLGTDVLRIPKNQQTMNLDSFTMSTPESEFHRVVRHEVGHTLGFPHEHMRRQIVGRLDPQKTIDYFQRTQGWNAQTTRQQVLTPLEDSALTATPDADQTSIMCYQLPAQITTDGLPVVGGLDINELDFKLAAELYPKAVAPPSPPPPPPPPPAGTHRLVVEYTGGPVQIKSVSVD